LLSFSLWSEKNTASRATVLISPKQTSSEYTPNVLNTVHNGQPAYATNDLLQEHPTLPGYWRVYGRADDQLMLLTGEKVVIHRQAYRYLLTVLL
jgi:hypothetical protein